MSVSAPTQGQSGHDEDLSAVVAGGQHFVSRLKIIKDARLEHDDALNNLRLGHDVVRAMQDVQRREQDVMDIAAKAEAEAKDLMEATKAEASKVLSDAKAEAEAVLAHAAAQGDALAREVDEAHAALSEHSIAATADSKRLMDEAVAIHTKARAGLTEADGLRAAAEKAKAEAEAMLAKARDYLAQLADWEAQGRAHADARPPLT